MNFHVATKWLKIITANSRVRSILQVCDCSLSLPLSLSLHLCILKLL